jgi:hypothetical protein
VPKLKEKLEELKAKKQKILIQKDLEMKEIQDLAKAYIIRAKNGEGKTN